MAAHSDLTGAPHPGRLPATSSRWTPRERAPSQVPLTSTGLERWQRRYAAAAAASDLALVVFCVTLGIAVGPDSDAAVHQARVASGMVTGVLLVTALLLARAWAARILGNGSEEFRRLFRAVFGSAIVLGLAGLALQVESVRMWVFGVVPLYGLLSAVARYGLRKIVHRARSEDRCMLTVLAVGSEEAVAQFVRRTRRDRHFGWTVTGACTPTGRGSDGSAEIDGVPVVGDLDSVSAAVHVFGYRVVAVAPAPGWGAARLHRLAWQLEDTQTELAVDPGLMEIAGPRLHITPVDGMPLLRLTQPRFTGIGRLVKATTDRILAAILLLLVAPLFTVIVVAVRRDGGRAFYVQERVGAGGRTFRMIKFRSMAVDADQQVARLAAHNDGAGPMFKMREDPRITRVGVVLRRYSLDELPQLINVLAGSMSLVGPRPPLPREVATYRDDARRRLLVRPGLTGLWQVSGRSDLSWEETIRLDLRYVENWSMSLDITILWKTLGAVVRGRGAY